MSAAPTLRFGPFRLDLAASQLYRGETPIELRPKTLAVLTYLAEHHGQLVSRNEIIDAVWPETAVQAGCDGSRWRD